MNADGMKEEPTEVTSESAFQGLRRAWRRLEERLARPSPFLTWDWMWTWWRHLRRREELSILTLWDGESLGAVAPLMLDETGQLGARALRFLGSGVTDDLDFILRPSYQSTIPLLLDASLRSSRWRLLDLRDILEDSPSVRPVYQWISDLSPGPPVIQFTAGLRLTPPADHTRYWRALSPRMRSKLRRGRRRLKAAFGPIRVRILSKPAEVRRAIEEYLRIQRLRWSSTTGSLYADFHFCQFLRDASVALASRGYTRLFQLHADGEVLACALAFETPLRTLTYGIAVPPAYRRFEVGFQLLHSVINETIQNGGREVDFLRGNEEYKRRLGGVPTRRARIRGAAPGLRSRLAMLRS